MSDDLKENVASLPRTGDVDPIARAIAETSTDNIMLLDPEGRIQYINWTVPDLTREGVIGSSVTAHVAAEFHDDMLRCFERIRATRKPDRYETYYVADNGETSFWESRVAPVVVDDKLVGLTVISSNVSERRRADAERDRFFNISLDILLIVNGEGRLVRGNPAFERLTGFTIEELSSRPLLEFVHRDDQESSRTVLSGLLRGETLLDFENRYRHKDGGYRTISWRAVSEPGRSLIYAVGRDVTDHKALEMQVRHAQKMDAIGQLAGGIAHDFNNLLLAIQGNTFFAKREADAEVRNRYLREIDEATHRAAELTRQLLTLSRRQPIVPIALDVNELGAQLTKLMSRLIPANISCEFIPGHALALVRGDLAQIEQVLMNLCLNARDAMPNGGVLTIETENVLVTDRYVGTHADAKPGRYVLITVTDTGMGMTPEVRERIFEPFFTTKEPGKGTGLGLATAYGIVAEHGGMLQVYSEPGKGSTFKVYLPVSERRAEQVGTKLEDHPQRWAGRETILVAEDEELLRNVVMRILESAGYTVVVACDGVEAVQQFLQHRSSIALAVLDLVMPRTGGVAASEQILAERPDLPIIFTSGYSDARSPSPKGVVLQKPYMPTELLRRVRTTLDGEE